MLKYKRIRCRRQRVLFLCENDRLNVSEKVGYQHIVQRVGEEVGAYTGSAVH